MTIDYENRVRGQLKKSENDDVRGNCSVEETMKGFSRKMLEM